MFPRIHVNDTEKGGPRAPPRKKMALYEQLSLPSKRFSSEGGVSDRGSFVPHPQTPSTRAADETNNQKKKQHDDFIVPNFNHSGNHQHKDNKTFSPYDLAYSNSLTNAKKTSERNTTQLKETSASSSFGHKNVSNTDSVRLLCNESSRDRVIESVDHNIRAGAGVSPDDVVGMIGQKLFWKARKAIINQQRVFAVQVSELHRLIKVQRLIAGSPQVTIDTVAFMGKPTKVSQIQKIPIDYVPISSANAPEVKHYHVKPKDDKRKFSLSAEKVFEKAPLSSVQNSYGSTSTRYPLPPADPKKDPWSQQPGQQWLIPVMSPSEGLIYKPYPAPGYMTPGPGPPPGKASFGHNFVNHGVPPSQWANGFQPLVHTPMHGYFPPYGTTAISPSGGEKMNSNLFNLQCQSSREVGTVVNFHESNNEVQVSTASCSSGTKTRDALALFPTRPPFEGPSEPTRAIRVVPRNARLATEFAGRIFRSLQEERKQQDPV
ncbi:protein EARLY FLOWERING 3-like [Bidens hawaiensis]|uniref:protein EARLY FLOWERING 3-like n=1 Tax=Bidens hawaiensis TaxID=980011 RepID=UPI004049C69D